MMDAPRLRIASPGDAAQLLAIYGSYTRQPTCLDMSHPSVELYRAHMEMTMERYPFIVAERDADDDVAREAGDIAGRHAAIDADAQGHEVVGYAYASREDAHAACAWNAQLAVYCKEGFTGMGVGSMLMHALLELLLAQGFCNASSRIALPNEASVALHRKFGFEDIGIHRHAGYRNGRWIDVLWMRKTLDATREPGSLLSVAELDPALVRGILTQRS